MLQFRAWCRAANSRACGVTDRAAKYCIIGAGASGLAVAKNFKLNGIAFECLEREADIGGLWNIDTQTGRRLRDDASGLGGILDLVRGFPDGRGRHAGLSEPCRRCWHYFRDYARHFGLCRTSSLAARSSGWHRAPTGDGT